MKRFTTCTKALAFCTFLLTSTPVAHACAWGGTDNYYLFYAFEGDRTTPGHAAQHLSAWWTKYVGRDVTTEQLSELAEIDPSQLRRSNNPLVRAATKKNDQTMLSYLRLLCEYLHVEPQGEDALWDYPDEAEKAERRRAYASIATRAAKLQSQRLAPQINLLRIRALFKAERWQNVVSLYTSHVGPAAASVFKDMATGFYAGALRKMGRDEDAAEIYASLGDVHSATWCVHDGRNLGTIRRLFKQNPNGGALRLLVQDFVNNAQETLDNANEDEGRLGRDDYFTAVYANEVKEFATFATAAAQNPQVEDPCLWLAAAAWTTFLHGEQSRGKQLIDQAMQAKGKALTKNTARYIRLAIYADMQTPQTLQTFEAFALPETKWIIEQAKASKDEQTRGAWYCTQRLLRKHLAGLYKRMGHDIEAALCIAIAEGLGNPYGETWTDVSTNPLHVEYSTEYIGNLRDLSGAQLERIYNALFNEPASPMLTLLYQQLTPAYQQRDLYADLAATAYAAEADFERAAAWGERVSLNYLSAQNISYYMARRDYNRERWMGPRQTLKEVKDGWGGEVPTALSSNQKLQFCRDVITLQQALQNATSNAARANLHYRLASLLYQAAYCGDCWYLSGYAYSSYKEKSKLVEQAYEHLTAAETLADKGAAPEVYTKVLFAKAFFNFFEPDPDETWDFYQLYSYNFNWDTQRYTLEFNADPKRREWNNYKKLAQHVRQLPAAARPDYLSRCDVLQTWLKRGM